MPFIWIHGSANAKFLQGKFLGRVWPCCLGAATSRPIPKRELDPASRPPSSAHAKAFHHTSEPFATHGAHFRLIPLVASPAKAESPSAGGIARGSGAPSDTCEGLQVGLGREFLEPVCACECVCVRVCVSVCLRVCIYVCLCVKAVLY